MTYDPFLDPPRERRGCAGAMFASVAAWIPLGVLWPTETALVLGVLLAGTVTGAALVVWISRRRALRARRALFDLFAQSKTEAW